MDKIELWTCNFDKPPVYWLNGLAGTGKTTIAQTVAERMFADGRLGASFFCSRDFEDRRSLRSIFPTLAVQLARRYSQFRSIFIQLVQSNPEIVHETLYAQMKKLIIQPLAKSAVSTVIVIDALDECKDKEPASAILSVLGQFVAEVPTVKFFITGRPESRIQEGFRLPSLNESTDVFVLHEVEAGQVETTYGRSSHIASRNSSVIDVGWETGLPKNRWTSFVHAQEGFLFTRWPRSGSSTTGAAVRRSSWIAFYNRRKAVHSKGRPNSRITKLSTLSTRPFSVRPSAATTQRMI